MDFSIPVYMLILMPLCLLGVLKIKDLLFGSKKEKQAKQAVLNMVTLNKLIISVQTILVETLDDLCSGKRTPSKEIADEIALKINEKMKGILTSDEFADIVDKDTFLKIYKEKLEKK